MGDPKIDEVEKELTPADILFNEINEANGGILKEWTSPWAKITLHFESDFVDVKKQNLGLTPREYVPLMKLFGHCKQLIEDNIIIPEDALEKFIEQVL